MSNGEVMNLKIYNNGKTEITQRVNGGNRSKVVSLDSLANFLSSYASGFSPLLPEGVIKHGFKNARFKVLIGYDECIYGQQYQIYGTYAYDGSMSDFESIAKEWDGCSRDDDDDDDDDNCNQFILNTYLPKTICLVDLYLDGDRYAINTRGCRIFHYFDAVLLPTTKLYAFPFGNVYDGNELCFGGMDFAGNRYKTDDVRGLSSFLHNWKSSESNSDLTYRTINSHRAFNYIYEQTDKIKDIKTIEELKANTSLHNEVRAHMESFLIDQGITFGTFLKDHME